MTEKRFTICVDSNDLKSLWDNERTEEEPLLWLTRSDRIGGIDNVCELLNELNNKIRELETRIDTYDAGNKTIHKRMMVYKEENEQLKKELSEYKDFVLSDDKILCYTCLFCTHKGIYEVDCDVKGHVDVHGTCHSYVKKELRE